MVRSFALCAMGRRVDPSWGGPIELFLVPASAPRLVQQRPCYVLSCLWDDAYKKNTCCYSERVAHVATADFLSHYLSGHLPYV